MKKDRYYRSLNEYMKREERKEMWKDVAGIVSIVILGVIFGYMLMLVI